jgi:hypothetical protein
VSRFGKRFWIEAGLGLLSSVLLTVTAIRPDWIELISGADPDGGNGTVELALVALLALIALGSFALAGAEWRKARRSAASRT